MRLIDACPIRRLGAVGVLCLAGLLLVSSCDMLGEGRPLELAGKIVFSATVDGDDNIYTMNADGSNLRQLTSYSGDAAIQPSWSPDGETIAFSNFYEASTLGPYVYLMDADGENKRFLKEYDQDFPKGVFGWNPTWSPDGKHVAYTYCLNCETYGHNLETAAVTVAGRFFGEDVVTAVTDHPARDGALEWGPNGEYVAFLSDRATGEPRQSDLYLAEATYWYDPVRLTERGGDESPHWSPDGEELVLSAKESEIVLLDLSLGSTRSVSYELEEGAQLGVEDWAANGTLLLTIYGEDEDRLVALNPDTYMYRDIDIPLSGVEHLNGADWHIEPPY